MNELEKDVQASNSNLERLIQSVMELLARSRDLLVYLQHQPPQVSGHKNDQPT